MPSALTIPLNGPAAFRALARAFEQFDNFDRFVAALQTALDASPVFKHTLIALDHRMAEGTERFPAGALSFPLLGDRGAIGTLQAGAITERRKFAAEDLHLLAGLADFLSAVIGQAQRLHDAGRGRELLRLLLNQAPVGIAAYGLDHRPIVANETATRWLGNASLPFADFESGAENFHLRIDGKLVCGEVRRIEHAGGAWIIVLHDLTPEQGRFLDGMQREVYRALAEQAPRSVVLLEVADLRHSALRRLPALRSVLEPGELAGPYDAHRAGLVLAAGGLALRSRLRKLGPLFDGLGGVRLGYAELGRDGRTPEDLLDAALHRYGSFPAMLRPALLIHDENPGVAATLAMILGREYRIVCSNDSGQTRRLLDEEPFDAIITELGHDPEQPSVDPAAHYARTVQPGIKAFLTSVRPKDSISVEPGYVVIEKPFDVAALTGLVRQHLGE